MKADVQYNDFYGTVAADISDELGKLGGNDLERIGDFFNLDKTRFKVIGISIYGTEEFSISLYCIDWEKSSENKEFIVSMSLPIENKNDILGFLFKRLHIVLHEKYDKEYSQILQIDDEIKYRDYHNVE